MRIFAWCRSQLRTLQDVCTHILHWWGKSSQWNCQARCKAIGLSLCSFSDHQDKNCAYKTLPELLMPFKKHVWPVENALFTVSALTADQCGKLCFQNPEIKNRNIKKSFKILINIGKCICLFCLITHLVCLVMVFVQNIMC